MNCHGCEEILIGPRQRASNYKRCIEQYYFIFGNKMTFSCMGEPDPQKKSAK